MIMQVMALIPKTQALQRVLVHFFRIAPPFCLGEALIELTRYHFEKSIMEAAAHTEAIQAATAPASSLGNIASTLQGLGLTTPSPTAAPSGTVAWAFPEPASRTALHCKAGLG